MSHYYFFNGQLIEAGQVSLHVSDLAILRGFGIFDYFLVSNGQPLFLEDYLNRFYRSAENLGLAIPVDSEQLTQQIAELLVANRRDNAGIRLVLTGGYAPDSYTPTQPNLLVMQHDYRPPPAWQYDEGVHLLSFDHQRELPEIKSINYLTGIRLQATLKARQADYLLYHDQGVVRESDRSNFFAVTREGTLVTPHEKILEGITRKQILKLADGKMRIEEREMHVNEFPQLKEAFLTSSTKGVMPVVKIDDQQIGNGKPGKATRRLRELFQELALGVFK